VESAGRQYVFQRDPQVRAPRGAIGEFAAASSHYRGRERRPVRLNTGVMCTLGKERLQRAKLVLFEIVVGG
jgi:hypothetical protein